MLQAKTKEQKERVLGIVGLDDVCCHFPLNFDKEMDCGCYEDYDDRIYIDGQITFDQMKQIVEYLEHSNDTEYWNRVLNKDSV